jgi:hypothetical protein
MEFLSDEEDDAISPPLASRYTYDVAESVYTVSYDGNTNDADMEVIPDAPVPTSLYEYTGADPVSTTEAEGGMDHTMDDSVAPSQEYEHYNELEPVDPYVHLRTGELEVRFYLPAQLSTVSGSEWWYNVKSGLREAHRAYPPDVLTTERVAVCLQSPTMRRHERPLCFAVLHYRVDETSRRGTVYVTEAGSWVDRIGLNEHLSSGLDDRSSEFLFACIETETIKGTYDTDRVTFTDVCLRSTKYTSRYAEKRGYVKVGNVYIKHCRDARV